SHQTEQYGPEQGQIFINSLGAKDEACRQVPAVAAGPRVVVFGDSFAEGWGLPFAETVPGQLRQDLAASGVDVLGFGISSHCPSLTERWMRKLLREGVRWNQAILMIDSGDSFDEREVKAFLEGRERRVRKNVPKFFRLRWYEYSLTYQVVNQIWSWMHPHENSGRDLRQASRGNEWKVAWLDNPEETPWFREGLEQSARAVARIEELAPYPKMMAENKMRNDYTLFWQKFAEERRIPFLDLSPLFEDPGKSPAQVYAENFIPGDFHWNARGSARVAEALLPWIRENLPARAVKSSREPSR
ncbi:MAG: SGNH/GDSL hydrolase family protein, partial [Actinobacteria bacterium]|nr:SGNH/GDSL hydrolase family protein [Actinomycetota bacterium]